MDRKEFFETYAPYAQAEQMRYGIPASVTLAQMWLESGGGSSYLAREGKNFFGIKALGGWTGDVLYANDDKKHEAFRKYDNVQDCIRNHSMFLMGDRYQKQCGLLEATDYKGWAKGIKAAGYATDPEYTSKLIGIIERNHLDEYDREAAATYLSNGKQCGKDKNQHFIVDAVKYNNSTFGMPLRDSDTMILNSDFGHRDIDYGSTEHEGIDLHAVKGTDVYASESGIVLTTGKQGVQNDGKVGAGNYIYVAYPRPDGSYRVASYMHLDSINVKPGDQVNANTILAKSGNSGGVRDHLHFGVAKVDKVDDIKALNDYIAKLSDPQQEAKWSDVRNAALGNTSGANYGHYYDAKEYLAEVAIVGKLNTKLEKKGDSKKENLLAAAKEKVSENDVILLAQKATSGEIEHFDIDQQMTAMTSLFGMDDASQGTGQNSLLELFKQSGMGGGGDLVSSLISMAMMLLFASMTGKSQSEKQAAANDVAQVLKGEKTDDEAGILVDPEAIREEAKKDKKGQHEGFDVASARSKGQQDYDLLRDGQESQEQQRIGQDENRGAALA